MKYLLILALAVGAFAHDKSKDKPTEPPELDDSQQWQAEQWLSGSMSIQLDQMKLFSQRISKSVQDRAKIDTFCPAPFVIKRLEDKWHCVATPSAPAITKQIPEGTRREEEAIHKAEEAKSKESK